MINLWYADLGAILGRARGDEPARLGVEPSADTGDEWQKLERFKMQRSVWRVRLRSGYQGQLGCASWEVKIWSVTNVIRSEWRHQRQR